jgi:N-acetylglucosamine-6-phosphate deacetylase
VTVLVNARVVTPAGILDPGWVSVAAGRIATVGTGDPPTGARVDLGGAWLLPGFVDLHVHGGGGAQFMSGDPDECRRAARFHVRHGTTALLATTLTAPPDELLAAVKGIAAAGDRAIVGAHLEGPWLSERRRGAQDAGALRPPDPGELAELMGAGPVRLVSLAPELPGGLALIERATAAGALAALAHTDATYEEAVAGIDAGASHAVHVFNGMRPLHHREPGVIGAVLEHGAVTCEVIADGHHVHPAVVRLLARIKGAGATVLVTDAIEAAGLPDGMYRLGREPVQVREGRALTASGQLAGSTLTMDAAVRNVCAWGIPLTDALAMAATTPAGVLGLRKGRIAPGYDADLTVLDDALLPVATLLGGVFAQQGA